MTRTVVTGASGFIGSKLVDQLVVAGHDVTVILHSGDLPGDSFEGLRIVHADITQVESLRGKFDRCDNVFHLAGCTIARSRAEFFRVNCEGTVNVARACEAASTPPKLLFVSSLAAVGPATEGRPLTEADAAAPVSQYGRSKCEAEKFLQAFSDKLSIQIVRPPAVMGEADPHMLGLFKTGKAGWVFLPGWTPFRYSMIHVDDLVKAILYVSMRDDVRLTPESTPSSANPGLVHLAQGPAMTFSQTAQVVRDRYGGGRLWAVHIPKTLCWLLAGANSSAASLLRNRPLLNLDKMREAMAGDWMADSSYLTKGLGFEFPHSLEERICQTAEGYQQRNWL